MVHIGQTIPDMELDAFHEKQIKKLRLSEFRGKWLVLLFYPADFTFVCPTELADVASLYDTFKQSNTEIASVSTDTAFVHKAWHDASPTIQQITYPMLADPTGKLCKAFGTYIENEGISLRGTFIIDPNGLVKAFEVHDNSIGRHAGELLRKVQAAQHVSKNPTQVCPARWQPGKETLQPNVDLIGKL